MSRGNLDHFAMIDNGGVYEHGIWMLRNKHLFQIGIKQFGVQVVFRSVVLREGLLRLDNCNQSGGLIARQRCQESLHVAVHQTNNCHSDWWLSGSMPGRGQKKKTANNYG